MASLSGNKIKDTYQSLIKLTDNGNLTTGAKQLTDGFGNNSPLYISTTQIGIGVTPEATYDLHVYQNAKVGGNLTITGDLTVNGTTTTVGTDTLSVKDPLIVLANNNTSADSVDIGFYGKYAPSGTTLYAGLFRDTGDNKFKIFRDLEDEPTTTVNTSGTGYTVATLVGNVEGTLTGVIASTTTATTQSANDNSTKVATTAYVDTSAGNYLPLAGGTMSGNIAMGGNDISNVGDITIDNININGNTITSTYTVALPDFTIDAGGDIILDAAGGNIDFKDNGLAVARFLNSSGDFIILTQGSDKDILFKGNDGGSEITALTLDMSEGGNATFNGDITVSGGDITLSGTGRIQGIDTVSASTDAASKGYVDSQVGANNELSEVLANGNTTGATKIEVDNTSSGIDFIDNAKARFGTDDDLEIYHNGTNAVIDNNTNNLVFNVAGKTIINSSSTDNELNLGHTTGNWFVKATNSNTLIIGSESNATNNITLDTSNSGSATFAGRVGIGQSAGTAKLEVAGEARVYTGSNLGYWGVDSGNSYVYFGTNTSNYGLSFQTSGSERVRIDSSGRVGINQTSPSSFFANASQLVIGDGSTSRGMTIYGSSAGDSQIFFADGVTGDQQYRGIFRYEHSSDAMVMFTSATERMRIDSSGTVSIGSSATSTDRRFQVTGTNTDLSATTTQFGIVNNPTYPNTITSNIYNLYTGPNVTSGATLTNLYNLYLEANNYSGSTVTNSYGLYQAGTSDKNYFAGNVGIGETSPDFRLHVKDTQTSDTAKLQLRLEGNNGNYYDLGRNYNTGFFEIQGNQTGYNNIILAPDSGNVGIGTSPASKLEVYGNVQSDTISIANSAAYIRGADVGIAIGQSASSPYGTWIQSLRNTDGVTFPMSLNPNGGNVGIGGISSPNAKLEIGSGQAKTVTSGVEWARFGTSNEASNYATLTCEVKGGATAADRKWIFQTIESGVANAGNIIFQPSGGNVGIGTDSPRNDANFVTLQVGNTTTGGSQLVLEDNDTNGPWRIISNQSLIINDDATERMRIDSSGAVGIGVSPESNRFASHDVLQVGARATLLANDTMSLTGQTALLDNLYYNSSGVLQHRGNAAGAMVQMYQGNTVFYNSNQTSGTPTVSERMRIDSSGRLLIGKTSTGLATVGIEAAVDTLRATKTNSAPVEFNRGGTDGDIVLFYKDTAIKGSVSITSSAVAYNTSSDYRLKENVVEMTNALDRVSQLKPSRFNFIGHEEIVDGFLAHEVSDIVPEAITGTKDEVDAEGNPVYQGIDQSKLVPLLVGAIQELKAEIETLKTQINK